ENIESSQNSGWNSLLGLKKDIQSDAPIGGCEEWHYSNGPLLETTWGQADGYNNSTPFLNCDYPYNGRAYTGCVATAIAQIIRYHEYPNNYNWTAMPNDNGSNEVSELMFDIGEAVDMDYGCDASSADNDVYEPTLENDFNYATSTDKIDYDGTSNYDVVIDELENERPVIFRGNKKGYIIGIFPYPESGHAWVADGYQHDFYCDTGVSYLSFYMNWGWDGNYNGWYGFNDFTPGNASFDYNSEVIVGIQP
ncbi:MAG: C10 family peptidase, partial [Balneolaceae bacterium]|nr:C10 family peptidase [Balneolaceae bacterium]